MVRWLVRRLRRSSRERLLSGVGLAAVLGVGTYLRLRDLDLDWFIVDQARDIRRAMGIIHGWALPLLGPEVQGGPAHTWGPLYFYLLAVPLAFSPNPLWAAVFLSVLNLAAVYLTYRFATRFFGRGVGLVSAALFATSPLAVLSGRGLWNLAPMPLLAGAFLYCLFVVVVDRRSIMIVPTMIALAGVVQLHFSGVAFLAVFVLALAIYRPSIRFRHLLLGAVGFVSLLLPYVVAQAFDELRDVRAMLSFSRASLGAVPENEVGLSLRPAFFGSAELTWWLGRTFGESAVTRAGSFVQRTSGYIMLIGAVYLAIRVVAAWTSRAFPLFRVDDSKRKSYGLLALWIWTPLGLLLFKRGLSPWYYRDVLYPAPFMAGAIVLADVLKYAAPRLHVTSGSPLRALACAGVLLVAVADVGSLARVRRLTELSGAMPLPSVLVSGGPVESANSIELMPMRYKERIVRSIVKRTSFEPTAFYRRVHGSAFDDVVDGGGFFLESLSAKRPPCPSPLSCVTPHYAVLRPDLARRFEIPSGSERVGPYAVVEYEPLIDYGSWAYAQGDSWTPVAIPTRGIPDETTYPSPPLFTWSHVPVLLRGEIEVRRVPTHFRLVVVLRPGHGGEHGVNECRVNDVTAPLDGVFSHFTLAGKTSETVFNLSGALHQGRNTVTCRLSGDGRRFDVDVYELQD